MIDARSFWMAIGRERGFRMAKMVLLLGKDAAGDEQEMVQRAMRHAKKIDAVDILRWRFAACLFEDSQKISVQSQALCRAFIIVGVPNTPRSFKENVLLLGAKFSFLKRQEFARRLSRLHGTIQ